jgi:hypothetical protein
MTTDNFCFYLQNRLIQTSQTGGQRYSDAPPPLVFPVMLLSFFYSGLLYFYERAPWAYSNSFGLRRRKTILVEWAPGGQVWSVPFFAALGSNLAPEATIDVGLTSKLENFFLNLLRVTKFAAEKLETAGVIALATLGDAVPIVEPGNTNWREGSVQLTSSLR